jgi:hypothetical protein
MHKTHTENHEEEMKKEMSTILACMCQAFQTSWTPLSQTLLLFQSFPAPIATMRVTWWVCGGNQIALGLGVKTYRLQRGIWLMRRLNYACSKSLEFVIRTSLNPSMTLHEYIQL